MHSGTKVIDKLQHGSVNPFLKWLGGKRWLMPVLEKELSGLGYRRYIEPFLGSGSFYFYFKLTPAFLSDINDDLINTYIQVRDNPKELLKRLKVIKTDATTYYEIRKSKPTSLVSRAVRFLYLNRTAFSGIYRVNEKGQFNVPFGNYRRATEILWRDDLLINASQALQGTRIFCSDFEPALQEAGEGDFVYCDPTYTVMHNNNGFRNYNENCFSWADQERLAKSCHEAAERGATVIVSNAYHEDIEQLYEGFELVVVQRKSVICPNSAKRKTIKEYVLIHSRTTF